MDDRPDELERRLRKRLDALGPAPRALARVLQALHIRSRLTRAAHASAAKGARSMRRRSALAIGIVVGTLILSTAVPAQAAVRLRQYKGQTSQAHNISFFVARTDAGRFIKEIEFNVDLTCDDQTTQRVGVGYGLQVPITDGAFSIDEVDQGAALHVAGDLGRLQGQGTLSWAFPAFTPDEQVQLCTTGDLTWEVEFRRIIQRAKVDAPAGHVVRAA